jgi:hypothetical protein
MNGNVVSPRQPGGIIAEGKLPRETPIAVRCMGSDGRVKP